MNSKHLDLFSGIGGFALAAQWAGYETIGFCEIDTFATKVLRKNFPGVPIHNDIKQLDGESYRGTVDLITGGFPCQPFSTAGKKKGEEDPRHLWPHMLRVIKQARPTWVVAENVAGFINMGLDSVQLDLENEGYTSRALVLPACAKAAAHRRDRVWIIAHTCDSVHSPQQEGQCEALGSRQDPVAHGKERDLAGWEHREWCPEPTVGRTIHGVSSGLDGRLKALGNAIVPQVAYEILRSLG